MKLTYLDPIHEGLYSVTLSDASQTVGTLAFDKIAVLDSSSSKNLVVSFINSILCVKGVVQMLVLIEYCLIVDVYVRGILLI